MTQLSRPTTRPHPAEQAKARGFGAPVPNFFTISFLSKPASSERTEHVEPQPISIPCADAAPVPADIVEPVVVNDVTDEIVADYVVAPRPDSPTLRRDARRWIEKTSRNARIRMLQYSRR